MRDRRLPADRFPVTALTRSDASGRSDAQRRRLWCVSHLDAALEPLYGQKFLRPTRGIPMDEAIVAASRKGLARFLLVLDAHLAGCVWMLGDRFQLVDVIVGASIDTVFMPALGVDRASYPYVSAWPARLAERPSWSTGRTAAA